MVQVQRTNAILYSDRFAEMIAFYGGVLGLDVTFENDWFVEFAVTDTSFVSVADAARTSIEPGGGAGLTLSWQVADVAQVRDQIAAAGGAVGEVGSRWDARVIDVHDPAGNRVEFWSVD